MSRPLDISKADVIEIVEKSSLKNRDLILKCAKTLIGENKPDIPGIHEPFETLAYNYNLARSKDWDNHTDKHKVTTKLGGSIMVYITIFDDLVGDIERLLLAPRKSMKWKENDERNEIVEEWVMRRLLPLIKDYR